MKISKIEDNKKRYMSLLFLADEQEDMIDRYLEKGTMYVLEENGVKAECVVTDEAAKFLKSRILLFCRNASAWATENG